MFCSKNDHTLTRVTSLVRAQESPVRLFLASICSHHPKDHLPLDNKIRASDINPTQDPRDPVVYTF